MTQIFLGYPPEHIRQWILDHASGSDKPEEKYMGPLCFTAEEDNATVGMIGPYNFSTNTKDVAVSLQTSTDGVNWNTYDGNGWDGRIITLNKGEKFYVKALNHNTNGFYDYDIDDYHNFVIQDGKVAASGNIQYLLDPMGERTDVPDHCYYSMFCGCTSLTQAPELPAETLAEDCYSNMFSGCTSLTQAPELPAMTLIFECYSTMFQGCTSLTQAPELPATTLAGQCYAYMFNSCTSLAQAPELPATTLDDLCYDHMFDGVQFLEVHMKSEMDGQYDPDGHGRFNDLEWTETDAITVVYDL